MNSFPGPVTQMRLAECEAILALALNSLEYNQRTSSYLEAAQSADYKIWELEANPRLFLLAENCDVEAATNRVTSYWVLRRSIFGQGNYLKRLLFRNNNAMNALDLTACEDGSFAVLPDHKLGNAVLCVDLDRRNKNCSQESVRRSIFYILSALCEQEQYHSVRSLSVLIVSRTPSFEWEDLEALAQLLDNVMPIILRDVHIVFTGLPLRKKIVEKTVSRFEELFGTHYQRRIYVHKNTDQEDLAQKLGSFGFTKNGLPISLGGCWVYTDFNIWLKSRIHQEEAISAVAAKNTAYCMKRKYDDSSATSDDLSVTKDSEPKYKNQKTEDHESLEDYGNELEDHREQLEKSIDKNKERLTMESGDDPELRAEVLRKRNAMYSKRKYYKKKLEVERLEKSRIELQTEKYQLQQENQRLQNLLLDAKEKVKIEELMSDLKQTITASGQSRPLGNLASSSSSNLTDTTSRFGPFPVSFEGPNTASQMDKRLLDAIAQTRTSMSNQATSVIQRQLELLTTQVSSKQLIQQSLSCSQHPNVGPLASDQAQSNLSSVLRSNQYQFSHSFNSRNGMSLETPRFLSRQNVSSINPSEQTQLQMLVSQLNPPRFLPNTLDRIDLSQTGNYPMHPERAGNDSAIKGLLKALQSNQRQSTVSRPPSQTNVQDSLIAFLLRARQQNDNQY